MSSPPSLNHLAAQISHNAAIISDFLSANGRRQLSVDPDRDQVLPNGEGFEQLQAARLALMEQTQLLHDLAAGPEDMATCIPLYSLQDLNVLLIIHRCSLHKVVPLQGMISFEEVAKTANLQVHRTRAVLRHAMTRRIFCEPKAGYVGHTAISAVFVKHPDCFDWLGQCVMETLPAVASISKTMDKYGDSLLATESPINVAFNTTMDPMSFIASGPESGPRHAGSMRWFGRTGQHDNRYMVENYPWEELDSGTIVDVGGGTAHMTQSIAEKFPNIKFVVQDLGKASDYFSIPVHLKDRVTFMVHDFFDPQSVVADAYILRMILHDWPDDKCAEILRQLIPALRDGTRIILIEVVIPEQGQVPAPLFRLVSAANLQMSLVNGRERSTVEWRSLVGAADSRLELDRIFSPPGSHFSAIEVVFRSK